MAESKIISRSVGTHDGSFHADEVTACALLVLFDLVDREHIVRTRDPQLLASCDYVCDVGGFYDPKKHLFDHHQAEYQGLMSSAGMVLEYLNETGIIANDLYKHFNNVLISGVDDHDNGRDPQIPGVCTYSNIITNFNTIHNDAPPLEQNEAFFNALDFALGHLKRLYDRYSYIKECRNLVAESMHQNGDFLIFDKSIPWIEAFFDLGGLNHKAKFVIMPAGEHWKLRGIPPTYQRKMEVRIPLPKEWAGLLEGDLKRVSKIEGAVFCHKGRFISVWETREAAFEAMEYTLKNAKDS
ncbi:MAG: MYG1 family protein [Parachlamydiales bacterium]|jgi:uncharacterized UPF0160 family protein